MKVAICIPCYRTTEGMFTLSLAEMLLYSAARGVEIKPFLRLGGVEANRRELTRSALDWGAENILWLDTDHVFPPHTLEALLVHDLRFVGCNQMKRVGESPTAFGPDLSPIWTTAESPPIEEVHLVGLGVTLTSAQVFRDVEQPWFTTQVLPDGRIVSEDYCLCIRARAKGYGVFVDHTLSRQVGHIGEVVRYFP